jgi:hypothetical protein
MVRIGTASLPRQEKHVKSIPRNVEILCSECFSSCKSLSSISFEFESRLTRIHWQACDVLLTSIAIPPMISFIDSEAFGAVCEVSVSECDSCVGLARWSAKHSHCDYHSASDFGRNLRIGCELPVLAHCLVDLSQFEAVKALGVSGEGNGSRLLYVRLSDCKRFVVESIGRFDPGRDEGGESGIERVIERQLNLKHHCIAAPIRFVVSNGGGGAGELRAVRPYVEGRSLADDISLSHHAGRSRRR